jgi:hypothetical protein
VITPLVGVVRVIRSELASADFPGATVRSEVTSSTAGPAGSEELQPIPAQG